MHASDQSRNLLHPRGKNMASAGALPRIQAHNDAISLPVLSHVLRGEKALG